MTQLSWPAHADGSSSSSRTSIFGDVAMELLEKSSECEPEDKPVPTALQRKHRKDFKACYEIATMCIQDRDASLIMLMRDAEEEEKSHGIRLSMEQYSRKYGSLVNNILESDRIYCELVEKVMTAAGIDLHAMQRMQFATHAPHIDIPREHVSNESLEDELVLRLSQLRASEVASLTLGRILRMMQGEQPKAETRIHCRQLALANRKHVQLGVGKMWRRAMQELTKKRGRYPGRFMPFRSSCFKAMSAGDRVFKLVRELTNMIGIDVETEYIVELSLRVATLILGNQETRTRSGNRRNRGSEIQKRKLLESAGHHHHPKKQKTMRTEK